MYDRLAVASTGMTRKTFSTPTTSTGMQAARNRIKLKVVHTEWVQSVQDDRNRVQLIARKATLVRVYLSSEGLTESIVVTGEIACRRGNAGEKFVPAQNKVTLQPGADRPLNQRREVLEESLNFRLPPEFLVNGKTHIRLTQLQAGFEVAVSFDLEEQTIAFKNVPPLRVRVIGLRYRDGADTYAPDAIHFSYLRSWLGRAYPVASVEWSQIVVDADFKPPFNEEDTPVHANAQIAALRSKDVSGDVDPRTHYYGLVSDGNGKHFMRGLAFDIPATASPGVVASGPAGSNPESGFNGDFDLSYADWYGAHELAHTFGRYHPGFPPPNERGGQDASDPTFPYPDGRISGDGDGYVGLDMGDPDLNLPMQIMPGHSCHDVMTYRENQWVSAYTFHAIRQRLEEENAP